MTFAEYAELSVSDPRVLVEIDIGFFNVQWVNNGAGLWAVSADNLYSWVDSTLVVSGFSAQGFSHIGSVQRDGITLTEVYTLAALTDQTDHWYYDVTNELLWVCLTNYDAPELHAITLGVVYGYSFDEFTPSGSPPCPYQGRLRSIPRISIARDPMFYGILAYGGGTVELGNADGAFDTFAKDNELYGNQARIYIGYDELAYADYERVYTGIVESFSVSHTVARFDLIDIRKTLTKPIQPELSATKHYPTLLIEELIEDAYGIPPPATAQNSYYTSAWSAVGADTNPYLSWYDSSILLNDNTIKPVSQYIQELLTAGFIIMWIAPDGRFSGSYVDHTTTTSSTIVRSEDILNDYEAVYDPTEVISSVKLGYAPTWTTTTSVYQYYRDTNSQASVYNTYKVYREHEIDLPIESATVAALWTSHFMGIYDHVRVAAEIQVPLKYYAVNVGDIIYVELARPAGTFIGTTLTEIVSKEWNLTGVPTLQLGIRGL